MIGNENCSFSVNKLIKNLCDNLIIENKSYKPKNETDVRKLKSISFEILLNHKSLPKIIIDPERELDILYFSSKLKAKNVHKNLIKCEEFSNLIQYVKNEDYFQLDIAKNLLIFLIHLNSKNSDLEYINNEISHSDDLLIPATFTLHSNYAKSISYYPSDLVEKQVLQNFKGISTLLNYKNPYLPRNLFNNHGTKFIEDIFDLEKNENVPQPFRFCENWSSDEGLISTPSGIDNPFSKILNNSSLEYKENDVSMEKSEPINLNVYDSKRIFNWNWECLGNKNGTYAEKSFATETCCSIHLKYLKEHSTGNNFSAKIISLKDFMSDLKFLTVGIQSDSFYYDEYIIFQMVDNLTITEVSPDIIKTFVNDFLECGTCYKRLQIMIMKTNYHLIFDGFLFKALCSAVEEYLLMFRKYVLSYNDTFPSKFYLRVKKMIKQITSLSFILAVHPNVDENTKPPIGSQILGYLYKEIMNVTEKNLTMLLVFILKRCTYVYFKHLQKWIYDGVLDDPSSELFICHVDHYRKNTKYFYDKAYVIRKESVPGFIQGFEEEILQCGKYTMLLKEFKPKHPIFKIENPSMTTCFSFQEIAQLETDCQVYNKNAFEVCGNTVNVKDIMQEIVDNRNAFFTKILEKTRKNLEKFEAEKKMKIMLNVEAKRQQFKDLTEQMEEHKIRKINDRLKNIEEEKQYLKEAKERGDLQLKYENLAAKKTIEYYQELYETIGKNKKIDKQKKLDRISINILLESPNENTPPISTDEAEFESCADEEEFASIDDYLSLANRNAEVISNSNFSENSTDFENNNLMENEYCDNDDNVSINEVGDINCNIRPESDAERNRRKNLGSNGENYFGYEACVNTKILSNINTIEENIRESEKIKQKTQKIEYNIDVSSANDVNANPLKSNNVNTELINEGQQNNAFNKTSQNLKLKLDFYSELKRNRQRVLESEYNIITGVPNNVPMSTSTTSDELSETFNGTEKENDRENTTTFADIDETITLCADTSNDKLEENQFVFEKSFNINPGIEDSLKLIEEENSSNNIFNDYDMKAKISIFDLKKLDKKESTYSRCEQLIKNNFNCDPINSIFDIKHFEQDNKLELTSSENRSELNILNVNTVTEFLQKSFLIPLNTRLSIMNKEIMKVFLTDLDLLGHFRSLRNFFFLMDGEFGSIISDGLIRKLERGCTPAELLNYQTLHSILDGAIGSTVMGNKNADNLSFIVNNIPEKFDINSPSVLLNVSLSYRVTWPLNLILNPETLDQYGNIFKYLIKVRRISWLLEESFQILKEIAKNCANDKKAVFASPQYRTVHQIRYKFSTFINSLKSHITSNAIESSWKTFKDELLKTKCIEDIYRKHTNYIKRVMFLCMLNRKSVEFYNAIENIFKVIIRFYRNLKSKDWKKNDLNYYTHSRYTKMLADELEFEKCIKYVIYLGKKIVKHGYQEEVGQFINLVNYNNFYDSTNTNHSIDNSNKTNNENKMKENL